jgi:hypothetical protein
MRNFIQYLEAGDPMPTNQPPTQSTPPMPSGGMDMGMGGSPMGGGMPPMGGSPMGGGMPPMDMGGGMGAPQMGNAPAKTFDLKPPSIWKVFEKILGKETKK